MNTDQGKTLHHKSTLFVFAYSPAGLGHLRVTDALHLGLPGDVIPILLGSQDETIRWQHRFISIHPTTRRMVEFFQRGTPEKIFTAFYQWILRHRTGILYRQMTNLIEEQFTQPETILVVATHFGLAHQLGAIKKRLQEEKNIKFILVVQVTDDSPQTLWYVPEADYIFVPSDSTGKTLLNVGRKTYGDKMVPTIVVNSYPVSVRLASKLSFWNYKKRAQQLKASATQPIHVAIPVSGAAVGTQFFIDLIDELHRLSPRFTFHVISKSAPYTYFFINDLMTRPYVKLYVSKSDRDIVHEYEKLYERIPIALELTKPSEQAFKALLTPKQRGGSILLFCEPVGRQEDDNVAFLRRHYLIPSSSDRDFLIKKAQENIALTPGEKRILQVQAVRWRGLETPLDAKEAAQFIVWTLKQEILDSMIHYKGPFIKTAQHRQELSPHGVDDFWSTIAQYLANV